MVRPGCSVCGAATSPGARFCGNCGAALTPRDDRDGPSGGPRTAKLIAAAVAVVAVAIAGIGSLGDAADTGGGARPAGVGDASPSDDRASGDPGGGGAVAVPDVADGTTPGRDAEAPAAAPACTVDTGGSRSEVGCVAWSAGTDPGPGAGSAVLGGRVVAVPDGDAMVGIGIARGERRWRVELPGAAVLPVAATPGLVVASGGGSLIAVQEADGTLRWSVELDPEEVVRVGPWLLVRTSREVAAVATGTGRVAWRRPLRTRDQVVLTDELAMVYDGRTLAGLSSNTGEVRWRREVGSLAARPRAAGGLILLLRDTGQILGLDADGGILIPPTPPLTEAARDAAFGVSDDGSVVTAAIGDAGAGFPGRLVRLDPATGTAVWRRPLPQPLQPYEVVVTDDLVLVTVGNGVAGFGLTAGEERFVLRQGAVLNDVAILPGGEVLLATAGGLSALDPATGTQRWQLRSGDSHLLSSQPLLASTADGPLAVRPPD